MERIANYIDGRLEAPRSGCYIDNTEPATGHVYSLTPDSDAADLEQAIVAAGRAFPEWSALPAEQRARLLLGIADRIEAETEPLARAESIDTGKPISLARQVDIPRAAANMRFFAHAITQFASEAHSMGPLAIDPTAKLNLVPVDRVVAGILAALTAPDAIGNRIHLATDNRIRSADMVRITSEELGVNVRLSDPTLYRNVTLPIVKAALERLGEPRLAGALEKLGSIFGGYGEWGQPVHGVGNDVRILGLPIRRPNTEHAFRMLCRHNRYVQQYGRVRDADEVARREEVWAAVLDRIEKRTGHEAGAIVPAEFRLLLAEEIDVLTFQRKEKA